MSRVALLLVGLVLPLVASANDLETSSNFVFAEVTGISQTGTATRKNPTETFEVTFKKYSFQTVSKVRLVSLSNAAALGQDYGVIVILENTGAPSTTETAQETTQKIKVPTLATPRRFFPIKQGY